MRSKGVYLFVLICIVITASAYTTNLDFISDGMLPSENNIVNPSQIVDDPDPITWTTLTSYWGDGRYWCPGTGVVRDTIWFCGGRSANSAQLTDIIAYVPATSTWIGPGYPFLLTGRRAGGGGQIGNKIYVAGGRTGATSLSSCEEFDVDTKVVTAKASMPTARWACASAVVNGKLYIIGKEPPVDGACYEYNPVSDTWITKAPCPSGYGWAAAAGAAGKVYLFGGSSSTAYVADCYEFDPVTNNWTQKASMPGPRGYHTAVAVNDQDIYVLGGSVNGVAVADGIVYKYNIAGNSWTTETPMPTARGWLMANYLNGAIYAAFGSQDWGVTNMLTTMERGSLTGAIAEQKLNKIIITTLNNVKPNPVVNGIAHISFSIPMQTNAKLIIYDVSGRLIATLVNSKLASGSYNLTWNGKDDANRAVAEGIYFYTLKTDTYTATKKLVLTR